MSWPPSVCSVLEQCQDACSSACKDKAHTPWGWRAAVPRGPGPAVMAQAAGLHSVVGKRVSNLECCCVAWSYVLSKADSPDVVNLSLPIYLYSFFVFIKKKQTDEAQTLDCSDSPMIVPPCQAPSAQAANPCSFAWMLHLHVRVHACSQSRLR